MNTFEIVRIVLLTSTFLVVGAGEAVSQTMWLASPGTNDVNTATNWSSGLPSATVDAKFATSSTLNPTQSAAITIRDMIFDPGASAFNYGITAGNLSLINPGLSIIENNSATTQVIGNTTGAGGTIGVSGLFNAAAGDLVVNAGIVVGDGSTNGIHFLAVTGPKNVYFNVDPSIHPSGNPSGGAWSSSTTTNMHSNARGRFFLSPTFSGRAYFGDLGTAYQGAINVESTANGALRLTHNNSLGAGGPVANHPKIQISGGTTGNGTLELAPATGSGLTLTRDVCFFDGRSGPVADDPHILNVSGDNLLTVVTDWNKGIRTVFGTTSTATIANPGNWNFQSDAGKLTFAGGLMYNTTAGALTMQLSGAGNGQIDNPLVVWSTFPALNISKKGSGTWTLTNLPEAGGSIVGAAATNQNSIYTGTLTVTDGTLALAGTTTLSGTTSVDVRSGKFFNVSGITGPTPGSLTLNTANLMLKGAGTITGSIVAGTSNTIAPGDSGTGTLTITNELTLNGDSTLPLQLSSTPGVNDRITVGGNLTLNGTTQVPLALTNGNLGAGTYTLMSYGGTLTGGLANLNITGLPVSPRQTFTPTSNTIAKQINVVVTDSAANLTWVGGVNGNVWADGQAVPNSINWTGHASDNHFYDGDSVTFDSSGSTFTPNVSGTVNPGSITFANGVGANYTVSGGTIVAGNFNYTGAGNATIASSNFTVTNSFTKGGSGTLTFSNTGATLSLPSSAAINAGTLTINRTDDLIGVAAIPTNFTGAGTLRKENTNTVEISGDNSGFTGTMEVASGTLATRSANALANTTVLAGATLDLGNNGAPTTGNNTKAVTIAGNGVGGLGAITVTVPGNADGNNAHIGNLTLAANSTIRVKSPAAGIPNRTILFVDGAVVGNGNALTAVVDASLGIVEIDFVNNGAANLGNLNLSGGGVFYIGGTTDIGASGTLTLGDAVLNGDPTDNTIGRFGVYGTQSLGGGTVVSVSKPIVVSSAGGAIELYRQIDTSYTISSPVLLNGDLDLTVFSGTNATTNTLAMAGAITGTGNLQVHNNANATVTRLGVVELTSDGNTYSGTTTIGGGFGATFATAANDRITLSIGNGGATGKIGPGDISVISPSATVAAAFQLNRTGNYTVPNNINTIGDAAEVRAVGGGMATLSGPIGGFGKVVVNSVGGGGLTLTGMNTYAGTTTVTSGKLLINGDNSLVTADTTVGAAGILGGTGSIGGNVLLVADGSSMTTSFSGGTIDPLAILGNIDLSGLSNSLTVSGTGTGTSWVIASYAGTLTDDFENVGAGYTVNYGTGTNSVITLNFVGLIGDYNNNGRVDAADYVLWRKNPGAFGGAGGYATWRAHFGEVLGQVGGASSGGLDGGNVPEPGTAALVIVAVLGLAFSSRTSRKHG